MEVADPPDVGCYCVRQCGACTCTCEIYCSREVIFLSGLVLTVMALVTHFTTRSPRFYLSEIHVPNNSTAHAGGNITYQFQIHNAAKLLGVRYDDLVFFVRDGDNARRNASFTVPGFYQGLRRTAQIDGEVEGGWAVKDNGTVVVGMEGSFRFKAKGLWKSKRKRVKVEAKAQINGTTGNLTANDWIQLLEVSSAPGFGSCYCEPVFGAVIGTAVAWLLLL